MTVRTNWRTENKNGKIPHMEKTKSDRSLRCQWHQASLRAAQQEQLWSGVENTQSQCSISAPNYLIRGKLESGERGERKNAALPIYSSIYNKISLFFSCPTWEKKNNNLLNGQMLVRLQWLRRQTHKMKHSEWGFLFSALVHSLKPPYCITDIYTNVTKQYGKKVFLGSDYKCLGQITLHYYCPQKSYKWNLI